MHPTIHAERTHLRRIGIGDIREATPNFPLGWAPFHAYAANDKVVFSGYASEVTVQSSCTSGSKHPNFNNCTGGCSDSTWGGNCTFTCAGGGCATANRNVPDSGITWNYVGPDSSLAMLQFDNTNAADPMIEVRWADNYPRAPFIRVGGSTYTDLHDVFTWDKPPHFIVTGNDSRLMTPTMVVSNAVNGQGRFFLGQKAKQQKFFFKMVKPVGKIACKNNRFFKKFPGDSIALLEQIPRTRQIIEHLQNQLMFPHQDFDGLHDRISRSSSPKGEILSAKKSSAGNRLLDKIRH